MFAAFALVGALAVAAPEPRSDPEGNPLPDGAVARPITNGE